MKYWQVHSVSAAWKLVYWAMNWLLWSVKCELAAGKAG